MTHSSEMTLVTDLVLSADKSRKLIDWLVAYYEDSPPEIQTEIESLIENAIDGYFTHQVEDLEIDPRTLEECASEGENPIEIYKNIHPNKTG